MVDDEDKIMLLTNKGQLAKAAKDYEINGAVLAKMRHDEWAELGVGSPLARCKLIAEVEQAEALG